MKSVNNLLIVALLCVSFGVQAQNFATENPNEFRLGVGVPTILNNGLFLYQCSCGYMFSHPYQGGNDVIYNGDLKATPTIELSYFYRFNSWFSLGANFTYMGLYQNEYYVYDRNYAGKSGIHSFALTPRVRFDWYRSKYVNLYSTVGVGLILNNNYDKDFNNQLTNNYLDPWVAVDFTPIGVMAGKKLFGYAELGASASGWGRIGIGYRFGNNNKEK